MDIRQYLGRIPEIDRFLTVDELVAGQARLAENYPDLARLRRVGTSKLGEPMHLLSIGHGSKNAFLFGCPHPNEPIGAMMVHHLSHLLCEDDGFRADFNAFTWHLIPCVDPDGTRLNEGWFAGPFTPRNYARHFFRPAPNQQVEWSFPFAYKRMYFDRPLPETQMLMRVIEELQPELMVSLHNAGFGGVYYYISRPDEGLYETFHQLPGWEELPLHLGEPEAPFMQELAPAIFRMPTSRESYDYVEANGGDPAKRSGGTSSADYAGKYDTLTLVIEMPYFDDPRVNDLSETATSRRAAILGGIELQEQVTAILREHLEAVQGDLRGHSPFETTVRATVNVYGEMLGIQRQWAESSPETDRPATVAELFSGEQHIRFYQLLGLGMLVRMLEGEIAIGNGTPAIREHLAGARRAFDDWADALDLSLNYRVIPIRKLVAVQLGAVLATADRLAHA